MLWRLTVRPSAGASYRSMAMARSRWSLPVSWKPLLTPGGSIQAPGTNPAARALPALFLLVVIEVWWLRGCETPNQAAVCPPPKGA